MSRFLTVLLCLTFLGCREQIFINIESTTATLVVSAEVNNQAEVYTVRLNEPSNYNNEVRNYQPKAVEKAEVFVEDATGKKFKFIEEFPGVYRSNPADFQGIVGQAYQLKIKLQNGDFYESTIEKLPKPEPIDDVYYQFHDGPKIDSMRFDVFFKTNDPAQKGNFYLLKFTKLIHKTTIPRPCIDQRNCTSDNSGCFELQISTQINLYSDKFINGKTFGEKLTFFPVNAFSPCEIEVVQASLSEKNYIYWQNLDAQNRTVGSIFDKIPAQVQGNIRCINDPQKIALGNFFVNGVFKQKLYIDRFSEKRVVESVQKILLQYPLPVGDCAGNNLFLTKPKGW